MNKEKITIIILSILLVLAIGVIAVFVIDGFDYLSFSEKIPEDDGLQVAALKSIYLKETSYVSDEYNIVLDESAMKNFITGNTFEGEDLESLKEVERVVEDARYTTVISMKYVPERRTIVVYVEEQYDPKVGGCLSSSTTRYKLSYFNGLLMYQETGISNMAFSMTVPREN